MVKAVQIPDKAVAYKAVFLHHAVLSAWSDKLDIFNIFPVLAHGIELIFNHTGVLLSQRRFFGVCGAADPGIL